MSTRSSARSAQRVDDAEKLRKRAIASIDARLAARRTPDQELIREWRTSEDVQKACGLLARALGARTRFGQDRTPLPLPAGLPLPPV